MPNKNLYQQDHESDSAKDVEIILTNELPHKRWRWVILVSTLVIKIIICGTYASFGLFMKEFMTYFQISYETVSWMVSIHSCLMVLVAPLASYFVIKFGHRFTAIIGLMLSAIGFGASYFYPHVWFVFLSISIINAIGQGFVNMCSTMVLTNYFQTNLPLVLGIYSCGQGVASILIAPLVNNLIQSHGWMMARLIYGTSYLFGALVAFTFKPYNEIEFVFSDDRSLANSKPEVNLTNIVKQNEFERNNFFESQTSKIHAFMSTASLASSMVKLPEVTSSRLSVMFHYSKIDLKDCQLNLVNINIPTMMGISVASNLNIKAFMSRMSIRSSDVQSVSDKQENYKSLFKNWLFLLFVVVNLFVNLGFDASFIFMKTKAIDIGIEEWYAQFLPICIGLGVILSRLGFGLIGTSKCIKAVNLYGCCLILAGFSLVTNWLAISLQLMLTYCTVFSVFITGYFSLNTIVLSSIVDICHFSDCLTIIYIVQAIGLLVGLPLSSYIYELTSTLNWPFSLNGSLILLGSLVFIITNGHRSTVS